MTSPQSPYPHGAHGPGPSYYHQTPVYGSSGPGPNPHYAYQYPPQAPPPHMNQHHPGPSRPNGRGGGPYNPRTHNHNPYAYYPPYGHHPNPVPMHSPNPHHQPYPRNQPYSPGYYLNPAAIPFTPHPRQNAQPPVSPAAKRPQPSPLEAPSASHNLPVSPQMHETSAPPQLDYVPPSEHLPSTEKVHTPTKPDFLAAESQSDSDDVIEPPPQTPSADSVPQDYLFGDPSSAPPEPSSDSTISFAIWSRRPSDPSRAPGIIISTKALPPTNVVEGALDTNTPPISPRPPKKQLPASDLVDYSHANSTVPSSAVTENADTPTVPGSPATTNTSVSTSNVASAPKEEAVAPAPSVVDPTPPPAEEVPVPAREEPVAVAAPETTPEPTTEPTPTPPAPVPAPAPAAPAVKKSWASLLRPAGSSTTTGPAKNALPTSSIVGFSIPADAAAAPAVSPTKKSELVNLLMGNPSPTTTAASVPNIRSRGLVNSGNMCFANAVLQILVYCPPFHKLFVDLGKLLAAEKVEKESGVWAGPPSAARAVSSSSTGGATTKKPSATPLVDATTQFLKEFLVEKKKGKNGNGASGSGYSYTGRGKGKERDFEMDDEEWDMDSFLPTYIYDAMKEKKRFETMGGGQQEDAEEFLGFYLDTLEEELLLLLNTVNAAEEALSTVEEHEGPASKEDGWMEVGKKNRSVVTRTIKAAESPITRIFGGKFRSTLRAPRQKDSVVVEDWRSLRLDIQKDQIRTIQDALSYISHPQPVQVSIPTQPGVPVEASQQVLIESLPPILVLHIKRFCYDTSVKGVVKVGKQIAFGPELEIGPELMAPAVKKTGTGATRYKLFGALYHHGLSASGGHYTLDVLHPNRYPNAVSTKPREGWVRIDDDLVSDVRPDDVFGTPEKDDSRCAYLLFYKRVA